MTWHEADDFPAQSISWGYSDGSSGSAFYSYADLAYWVQIDLLPLMNPALDLSWVQVWGYSGGGAYADIVLYDEFEFCVP